MNETQELVTIIPWTFIAQILNLLIQLRLIKHFLFQPVTAVLEKRKAAAESILLDARIAKRDADNLKAAYESRLGMAESKADAILQTARKEAQNHSKTILKEATEQAAAIKGKAETEIRQERKRVVNEIKNELGSIAMDIAGKVIEREIREEDHKKLIDQFIKNAGEAS